MSCFFFRNSPLDSCFTRGCNPSNGQCFVNAIDCNDGNPCTSDFCQAGIGCRNVPINCSVNDTSCVKYSCVNGVCIGANVQCNDMEPCTVDTCVEGLPRLLFFFFSCFFLKKTSLFAGVGCRYTPFVCAQSSKCFVTNCTGGDSAGRPICSPTRAINCTDNSSCTIDSCTESDGCVVSFSSLGVFFFPLIFCPKKSTFL